MQSVKTPGWVTQFAFFLALGALLVAFAPRLWSAENPIRISEEELKGLTNQVVFRSYSAEKMTRNPEDLVVGVGENLARAMLQKGTGGWAEDYQFIRIPPSAGALGADLMVLGPKSQINHVVNLQRLLVGYLSAVYGYTRPRGQVVAQFLLTYNAVKRGDSAYLAGRFVPEVAAQVPAARMGIALEYTEWAGKTILIIPTSRSLGLSAAEVGRVATDRLAENAASTNARKAFLDLRREQVATFETNNAAEAEALRKARLAQEQREAEALQRAAVARSDDEAKRARDEQARLDAVRREMERTNREADRRVIAAAEERAAIAREEKRLETPVAIAPAPGVNETNSAAATRALMPPRSDTPRDGSPTTNSQGEIFFLKTLGVTNGRQIQQLLLIDPKFDTAQVIPLSGVSGSHLQFIGADPVLILSDGKKNVLARIDRTNLTPVAQSTENVFAGSKIWVQDGLLYAVGELSGQTHLLQFDAQMKLLARSDVVVYPDTQLAFAENKVYATVLQGNQTSHVLVLRKDTLARILVIR